MIIEITDYEREILHDLVIAKQLEKDENHQYVNSDNKPLMDALNNLNQKLNERLEVICHNPKKPKLSDTKKIEAETVTMSLERYEHMKDHMEDLYKDNNILKNNINYFALKKKYDKIPKWIRNLFN